MQDEPEPPKEGLVNVVDEVGRQDDDPLKSLNVVQ